MQTCGKCYRNTCSRSHITNNYRSQQSPFLHKTGQHPFPRLTGTVKTQEKQKFTKVQSFATGWCSSEKAVHVMLAYILDALSHCPQTPRVQSACESCIYVAEAFVPAAPPAAEPFFMAPLGLGLGSSSCKGTSVRRPFTI